MVFSDLLQAFQKTNGLGCATCMQSSYCLVWRIILLFINFGLSAFDCYSDWQVWIRITESGFNHPLLQMPVHWTRAWLVFTCAGTATAGLYILNELSGVLIFYRRYKKSRNGEQADICRPCNAGGFNYVTRAEILALVNNSLEDLPLLILSLLFAAAQYSCNHPTPEDNSSILRLVLISSLASLMEVGWSISRFVVRMSQRACSNRTPTKGEPTIISKSVVVRANQLLYPKQHKMKFCIISHLITGIAMYGLTLCISVTAIALTQHHGVLNGSFLINPNQELNIYRSYPQEQQLINVSSILNHKRGVCFTEEFIVPDNGNHTIGCKVALLYSAENGLVYFDYAEIMNKTVTTIFNTTKSAQNCAVYYDSMFLGHYTTAGIRRFEETCLSVLILANSKAVLQKQENLTNTVNC